MEIIQMFDCTTGEITERPLTTDELKQLEKDRLDTELKIEEAKQRAAKKTEAVAKLTALGLTADDLKALGL